ncbi:MAG: hypothetical protein B6U95_03860 [Thermofilum sp. ex4484_82]|nr:MAG: hypothetical protein B6U95_03860 [Thermofilum sp. ex4484_82]
MMVKGWLSLLAFAGGLYFGREAKAKVIKINPSVIFIPPRNLESIEEPFNPEKIVRHILKEVWDLELDDKEIKALSKELDKIIRQKDPNLDRLMKIYRRQYYLSKIQKVNNAFCEGRIDRTTYVELMRRYTSMLAKIELP